MVATMPKPRRDVQQATRTLGPLHQEGGEGTKFRSAKELFLPDLYVGEASMKASVVYRSVVLSTFALLFVGSPLALKQGLAAITSQGSFLQFDGGDRVIIPNSASVTPAKITVECLVNFGRLASGSVTNGGDRTEGGYYLAQGSRENCLFFGLGPFWDGHIVSADTPLEKGRWYNVAGTYDGNELSLYLDGLLLNSLTVGAVSIGNSSPLYFSYDDVGGFPYFLTGQMDEVRIWDYARNATEIRSTMGVQLSGSEPGLAAYWNFNEAIDSQTVYDVTAAFNDGQLGSSPGVDFDDPTRSAVPEPASLAVWSILAMVGIGGCYWRKRKQ
jgi:hypothetical protein